MAKLAYTKKGAGKEAILFIHGIMASKEVWKDQLEYFEKKYQIIAIDLYGFGASKGEFRDSSFEDHAQDIRELLHELGISKVNIVGWSMGASVAIVFSSLFPDMIEKLVLVDGTPQLIASDDFPDAVPPEAAQQLGLALQNDYQSGCQAFADMQVNEQDSKNAKNTILNILLETDPQVALSHFASSGKRDLRPLLQNIKATTLVICGEIDQVCPLGASKYLAEHISDSTLSVFKEKGHCCFLTDHKHFNSELSSFISNNKI